MLNSWDSVASYIKKHHPSQTVAMRATELSNDNDISFSKNFEGTSETNRTRQFFVKRKLGMHVPIINKFFPYFPLSLNYILVYFFKLKHITYIHNCPLQPVS